MLSGVSAKFVRYRRLIASFMDRLWRHHRRLLLLILALAAILWLLMFVGTERERRALDDAIESIKDDNRKRRMSQRPEAVRQVLADPDLPSASKPRLLRRRMLVRDDKDPRPHWATSLYYDANSPPEMFLHWKETKTIDCAGTFSRYDYAFAHLKDVVVDKSKFESGRRGGELVKDVLNQDEQSEYYKVKPGAFQMTACRNMSPYNFDGEHNHLNEWYATVRESLTSSQETSEFVGFTIAVKRYEYANLYHTMTDWYNAFLMMQFFGRTAAETNILIVDTHPYGALDTVWPQLFNSTFRLSALANRTRFRHLVWSIIGYESPMKTSPGIYPPLYEEFRTFFLSGYGMENGNRTRNCSSLSVRFIWRRDYVAHPRNPTGRVTRKIRNEAELIAHVRRSHPEFREVVGVQIDKMSMRDQLRFILDADILVGVCGAGLAHAAFLQPGSGLVEIDPDDSWSAQLHFQAIAEWRRLVFRQWVNLEMTLYNESEGWLIVRPLRSVDALIANVARRMCSRPESDKTTASGTSNSNFS